MVQQWPRKNEATHTHMAYARTLETMYQYPENNTIYILLYECMRSLDLGGGSTGASSSSPNLDRMVTSLGHVDGLRSASVA